MTVPIDLRRVSAHLIWLLVALAGAGVSGGCNGTARTDRPAAQVTALPLGEPLRIMSFNIRYGAADDGADSWVHRQDLVASTITAFSPDLLGVQECLDFQASMLREQLPDYGFVGAGRDNGRTGGEMCGVFYRVARFEKLAEGHFWLSETPEFVASRGWDAALTRMATWVRLRTRDQNPTTFLFLNTHFDHVGRTARRQSARIILEQLDRIAGELPVVVVGDFNAPADPTTAGPYRVLTERGGLVDTYRVLHEPSRTEGTFNGFDGETGGARIDWILTSDDWHVRKARIIRRQRHGRYPSDHFPVTAIVDLPPTAE